MSVKSISSAFALVLLGSNPGSRLAPAATPTAFFGVSAVVQARCLVSASALTLSTHTGSGSNVTSTVSVNCTNATPYNISLSASPSNRAATASPTMAATDSALLSYELASDSHEVVIRGWMLDTDTIARSGNGAPQMIAVHRNIVAGDHVAARAYPDTITVTIAY
jgi:spore coat protein U-like protein